MEPTRRTRPDRQPPPTSLGQGRFGVGELDPTDPILPVGEGESGELPAEPGGTRGLGNEQGELLTGGRGDLGELELDPGDRGRRWLPLEPGEQEPIDRLTLGRGLGEALFDGERGRCPPPGECRIELETQLDPTGRRATSQELIAERAGQPVEHEPQRLEVLDRRFEPQPQDEPLGSAMGPERDDLLPIGPGVDPLALGAEPGDQCRAGQRRDRIDPTQPEPAEPGPDIRVRGQQGGRERPEEGRLATRFHDPRMARGLRRPGSGGGREPRPGDPDPGSAREDPGERPDDPLHEDRLGSPQPLKPVDLDLEQPEGRVGGVGCAGDTGAEPAERLQRPLDRRPVRGRIRVEECRLRSQSMGGSERLPASNPELTSRRVRVEDRPVGPRSSAEDDRSGRERSEARVRDRARPDEAEREMRPEEVEQSHDGRSMAGR